MKVLEGSFNQEMALRDCESMSKVRCKLCYLLDGEADAAEDVPRVHDAQELVLRGRLVEQRSLLIHEERVRNPY